MSGLVRAGLIAAAGLLAAAGIVTTASTPRPALAADKKAGDQCFDSHNINGFNAPNDTTLYIRVGVNDTYRLDLSPGCEGLSFRQGIALRSVPPGDPFICSPLQAEVGFSDTGIPERCQVNAIHKLSADEWAALPKRNRP